MFDRSFWWLAGAVALCLAGLGAANGWERAHSPETLVRVAAANAAVLPQPGGDYIVAVRCGTKVTHLQRVSDLAFAGAPSTAQVAGVLAGAVVAVRAARKLSGTTAVAAGVFGGSATELLKGRFAAMRAAALPSASEKLVERVGKVGVLLVIAGVAYYGADYLAGRTEPGCDSEELATALADEGNRYRLQQAIYDSDRARLDRAQPPRLDLAHIAVTTKGVLRPKRIDQLAFADLGQRCATASAGRALRVCTYL